MSWLSISFVNAMSHACPAELAADLVADMAERGHPIEDFEKKYGREYAAHFNGNPKAITDWSFDCGGFWIQGEPEESIEVDGLRIDISCAHFDAVLKAAKELPNRKFASGVEYHKLKLWLHATVLTPAQLASVIAQMTVLKVSASERYDEFDRQWKRELEQKAVQP